MQLPVDLLLRRGGEIERGPFLPHDLEDPDVRLALVASGERHLDMGLQKIQCVL